MKMYKTDANHPFEWYLNKSTADFLTYEGTDTSLKLVLEPEEVGKDVFSLPVPTLGGTKTKVMLKSTTLSGFINTNITSASNNGHMVNPRTDFGSVEIHYYVKHISGTGAYQIGGPTCFDSPQACQGMQYLSQLRSNGFGRLAKKQWYPSGVSYEPEKALAASITGRWVGMKLCIIIMSQGRVRIEQYYDDGDETNSWKPVNRRFDSNNWGALAGRCGALEGMEGQALDFKMPNIMLFGAIGTSACQVKKGCIRSIMDVKDDTSIPLPTEGFGSTIHIEKEPLKSSYEDAMDRPAISPDPEDFGQPVPGEV